MVSRATKPKRSKALAKNGEILPPERRQTRPGTFQPGHKMSANANMPRGRFITAQLIRLMHETIDDPEFDPNDKTKVRARAKAVYFFCRKLMTMALQGDVACLKMVMDRIEGSPISTTLFKPSDDPDALNPEQNAALHITRDRLAAMSQEERLSLFNATMSEQPDAVGQT